MTIDQIKQLLEQNNIVLLGQVAQHVDQRIKEVHGRLDVQDKRIDQIYTIVDGVAKRQETDEQERLIIGARQDHHEEWIGRAAKQLKIEYRSAG